MSKPTPLVHQRQPSLLPFLGLMLGLLLLIVACFFWLGKPNTSPAEASNIETQLNDSTNTVSEENENNDDDDDDDW